MVEVADRSAVPADGPERLVRRILRLFAPYRRRVALIVALIVLLAAFGVANPLLVKVVFDRALFARGGPRLDLLWLLCALMLGIALATGALGVWQTALTNRLGQGVMLDLRNRLFRHLQELSLSFFTGVRTGELQSRITSDVAGVQTVLSTTVSNVVSNAVTLVSAVVAMLILSVPLTIVSLLALPLFVLAARMVGARRRRLTGAAQRSTADVTAITQETLSVSGVTLAKLFGRQDHEVGRFERENRRLSDLAARQQVLGQAFFTLVFTFLGATPVIVYLVVGYLLDGGAALTAGTVVAFTTLQNRVFFPTAQLLQTGVELQSSLALFERIFGYLDLRPDIVERPDAVELPADRARGEVGFHEVRLRYEAPERHDGDGDGAAAAVPGDGRTLLGEGRRAWALDGISFSAQAGALVAFVGPSGAGKSSIVNLVARLYDPTEGAVRIDGVDLRDLRFSSLARLIGMVTQESYLFADTLRANIAYGRLDASDDDVVLAARAAAIHDRILELPDGYGTAVGERGVRLSGGERQRVAIARVLLHDPRVLVLDEATSSLDTSSERQVQSALATLMRGRTTLAVAHRLSTIQAADVIHVVDHGRIVESGDHGALVAAGGLYARLYEEQFEGGRVEARCADGVVFTDGTCRFDDSATTSARRQLATR